MEQFATFDREKGFAWIYFIILKCYKFWNVQLIDNKV